MNIQIDFERSQNKKLEKELKKLQASLEQEQGNAKKHKQVAIMLIKERRQLAEKLNLERRRCRMLELHLLEERQKMKNMAEGLMEESKKSLIMEATMEKHLSDFDTQCEQLRQKLTREETNNCELNQELESCRQQLAAYQRQMAEKRPREGPDSIEIKSSVNAKAQSEESARANSTPSPPVALVDPGASPGKAVTTEPVASHGCRVTVNQMDAAGATTFTMPLGAKVSFTVGQSHPHQRRVYVNRGSPPPVPPNKPTFLAGGMVRKDSPIYPGASIEARKAALGQRVGVIVGEDRSKNELIAQSESAANP